MHLPQCKLATQLLSKSVADGLQVCLDKGWIENCSGTIKFIRTFNDTFDLLNCHFEHGNIIYIFFFFNLNLYFLGSGSKAALTIENFEEVTFKILDHQQYIRGLKKKTGEKLLINRQKTGFLGLFLACPLFLN